MTSLIHRLEQASEGDLLPCPFCGGEAGIHEGAARHYVACHNVDCFCALGEGYDRDAWPEHAFESEQDAATAWNTRVDPALKSHTQGQGVE